MDSSSNPIITEVCLQPKSDLDQLTLSLLMNKQSYNKIAHKQNPDKSREIIEHHEKMDKFREQILNITRSKLYDPDLQISNAIDDIFDGYVKTIIRHIEQKEAEQANKFNHDNDEEDIMFGSMDEPEPTMNKSYWGKQTVLKQGYLSNDFFAKPKDK
jgi:hypothetical protein